MKIVIFQGGLGNQMFQCQLLYQLREKYHNVKAIDFCGNSHNGYEIEKYFDVEIPFCHNAFIILLSKLSQLPIKLKQRIIIDDSHYTDTFPALFFIGYWQEKKYLSKCYLHFKKLPLNDLNTQILNRIESSNSVSIHVRRGDYLKEGIKDVYVNLSETDYYKRSIQIICKDVQTPFFFIFSDDIEWCKKNFQVNNVFFVDWNRGKDSIYDMYLMSKCKYNIIGNSTFSFWGAYLNHYSKKVIYPLNWYKHHSIDIFPNEWIGV